MGLNLLFCGLKCVLDHNLGSPNIRILYQSVSRNLFQYSSLKGGLAFTAEPQSGLGNLNILANRVSPVNVLGHQPLRTRVKDFFRRPSEHRRVKRHGWKARMSTPGGRQVIMRRMLKGRHCLTH